MDELMGNLSQENSEKIDRKLMSVEISLLFRGFQKLDKTNDGFLSPSDLKEFCKPFKVNLRSEDIVNIMWLMDDHRRDMLTFDDVMKFYIRNRDNFMASATEFEAREKSSRQGEISDKEKDEKIIRKGFGAFGVENEIAKLIVFDGEKHSDSLDDAAAPLASKERKKSPNNSSSPRPSQHSRQATSNICQKITISQKDVVEKVVFKSSNLHCQPLMLFRILFFVSMQNSGGDVHLLTAFQNLSQLFGRGAETHFNCIFLRNFLDISDQDRLSLHSFVEHMKKIKLEVKRHRLRVNMFR